MVQELEEVELQHGITTFKCEVLRLRGKSGESYANLQDPSLLGRHTKDPSC